MSPPSIGVFFIYYRCLPYLSAHFNRPSRDGAGPLRGLLKKRTSVQDKSWINFAFLIYNTRAKGVEGG
jgi:hypothetical protein